MHRILNIAGNEKNNDDLIEQPVADFIFITSVKADLNLISNLLLEEEFSSLTNNIRAIEISNLNSLTQIDNYLLKTVNYAKVVILRLFGDKGTWNYGIEQLLNWQEVNKKRRLIILSGTIDQEVSLCEISSIDKNIALNIKNYIINGGFIFAMCSATDSFDIALASLETDIAASVFDGTPIDPDYLNKTILLINIGERNSTISGLQNSSLQVTHSYDGSIEEQPGFLSNT